MSTSSNSLADLGGLPVLSGVTGRTPTGIRDGRARRRRVAGVVCVLEDCPVWRRWRSTRPLPLARRTPPPTSNCVDAALCVGCGLTCAAD